MIKIGRNDHCPCGSGKKYKNCCAKITDEERTFSTHQLRMLGMSSFAPPPPWTNQYKELKAKSEIDFDNGRNVELAKTLYKSATSKLLCYLSNGAGFLCDQNIRYFLREYNDRLFNHSMWAMPSSFNVIEAFVMFNPSYVCLELHQEKDHLFSFEDYLEFVTSEKCNDKMEEALKYYDNQVIYNFNNSDTYTNFTFRSNSGHEYVLGGISFIRYKDELNILMTVGELTDTKEMDLLLEKKHTLIPSESNNPHKKGLKISDESKTKAARLAGIENIWQNIVLTRFDFSDNTQNVRYILKDEGRSFEVITDDINVFTKNGNWVGDDSKRLLDSMIPILNDNMTLFEISKMLIYLPMFFHFHISDVLTERHSTNLSNTLSKKDIEEQIEVRNKIYYRLVDVLPKTSNIRPHIISTMAPEIKIEVSGYWKTLLPNQIGLDKNGNQIHGKTWVEQRLSWLETDNADIVKLYSGNKDKVLDEENKGFIYIMRSAAHADNIFKIGLTKRSAEIRANELSRNTSSPDKFLVVEEWLVKDCIIVEKLIHEKLEHYRINPNREYFRAPYKIIKKEVEVILKDYLIE